jgi:hypothetical protein
MVVLILNLFFRVFDKKTSISVKIAWFLRIASVGLTVNGCGGDETDAILPAVDMALAAD